MIKHNNLTVTEIDANAQSNPLLVGNIGLAIQHLALHFGRATNRIHHAWKLYKHPVAGGLNDAALVLTDFRIHQLSAIRLQPFERALFIRADVARRTK